MYNVQVCIYTLIFYFMINFKAANSEIFINGGSSRLTGAQSRSDPGQYNDNRLEDDSLPYNPDIEEPATPRPYIKPGGWATPPPESGIDLGFTPVQTYLQVRRTSTVKRLPRSEAVKEATSLDEVLNAHRLKEVLRTKKIQEVYSEEGYEDAGYDHGNHERQAEHDEGYNHHNAGKYRVKDPIQHIQDIADSESRLVENSKPKPNTPKYSRKRVESTSMKLAYTNDRKIPKTDTKNQQQSKKYKRAPIDRSTENKKEKPTIKRDFVSPKDDFWNIPSSFENLSVSKWGANFEPMSRRKGKGDESSKKVRIPPVPTFGYIHSLTDAHYGSQAPMTYVQPKPIPSHVINLTEALRPSSTQSTASFEPRRIKKRIKRTPQNSESDEYEKELKKNLDEQEKNIITSALQNLNIDNDIYEKYPLFKPANQPIVKQGMPWKTVGFDSYKYPYFYSKDLDSHSPLRYASHPREFPTKSGNGMEFYDERDRAVECEEINVSLDDEPKENSTRHLSEQPGEKKRIVGLGDKIQCLKIKYFGEDPLDSPFFKEDDLKKQVRTTTPSSIETLKFHSSYQYQPNQSLDIFIKEKLNDSNVESSEERVKYQVVHPEPVREIQNQNFTEDFRVIPVRENYPELTTSAPIRGMRPPPIRFFNLPLSVIRIPRKPKPAKLMKTIKFNDNCLQPVSRFTISERSDEDIMFDCLDAKLLQTKLNGNVHFKIIPKIKKRRADLFDFLGDDSLRAGEVIESGMSIRQKRSTPSPRRKSSLFPNKSLLDKIVRRPTFEESKNNTHAVVDLGIKSPEEFPEIKEAPTTKRSETPRKIITTTTTTTSTTTPIPTTEVTIKFEPRPLKRLSGRDFLVRYHKTKGTKAKAMPQNEFWKLKENQSVAKLENVRQQKEATTEEPRVNKFQVNNQRLQSIKREERSHVSFSEGEAMDRSWNSDQEDPGPTPVLLFVVDESTGRGHWINQPSSTEETLQPTTTKKLNNREAKKQNARKLFFDKKLHKNL